MKCPFCNNIVTKVIDSRMSDDNSTRRRRECERCKKRFTTYEKIETSSVYVIKKDNRREVFDKEKLKRGILSFCIKRPISIATINDLVDEIEMELLLSPDSEVKSIEIGEIVLSKLKKIDDVAYIRFASVYRNFCEVNNFNDELAKFGIHLKKR